MADVKMPGMRLSTHAAPHFVVARNVEELLEPVADHRFILSSKNDVFVTRDFQHSQ